MSEPVQLRLGDYVRRVKQRGYSKAWRDRNPEKHRDYNEWYKATYPDRIKEIQKKSRARSSKTRHALQVQQWRRKNPDKWRAIIRRSKLKRYRSDPSFRLREVISARIWGALRRRKSTKSHPIEELIGASLDLLRAHLESKFSDGMSWSNMGRKGWHIDHVRPCALFDLTNPVQQRECFHYTNLQPLWWRDNLSKGAKC